MPYDRRLRRSPYQPPKQRVQDKRPGEETRMQENTPTRDYSWSSVRYMEDGVSYHDDPSLNFSRVSQEDYNSIPMSGWIGSMSIDTALETMLPLELGRRLQEELIPLGVNPYEYTDIGKKYMETGQEWGPPEPDLEITPSLKSVWGKLSPGLRNEINQVFEKDYARFRDILDRNPKGERNAIRNHARANVLKKAVEEPNAKDLVSGESTELWGTDLFVEMASRYARKGLPYPVAAARFAKATGYRLTPGVYEIVADQAGTRELIRIAELPKFRCSGCGMMFTANVDSDANNVTCPGCGSMGVTSLDLMNSQSSPSRNTGISTEQTYSRENLSDFADSPPAHGASLMSQSADFIPASETPLGPGDVIRNEFSGNQVKIVSASVDGVRGWSVFTHRAQTISKDDLWAWEKVGHRIDACEVVD